MSYELYAILNGLDDGLVAVDPEGDIRILNEDRTSHNLEDVIKWMAEARVNLEKLDKIIEWAKLAPLRRQS